MKKLVFVLICVLALSIGFSYGCWAYMDAKSAEVYPITVCNSTLDRVDKAMLTLGISERFKDTITLDDGTIIVIRATYEDGVRTATNIEMDFDNGFTNYDI